MPGGSVFPEVEAASEMVRGLLPQEGRRAAAGLARFRFAPAAPLGALRIPGHPPSVSPRPRIVFALMAAVIALTSAFVVPSLSSRSPNSSGASTSSPGPPTATRSSAPRALRFAPNVGQTDPAVRFVAQGAGYSIFLTRSEIVLSLQRAWASDGATSGQIPGGPGVTAGSERPSGPQGAVLRMQLVGANTASVLSGEQSQPSRMTYIVGSDPSAWHSGVATFAQVRYGEIYPGIDLVVRATEAQPEFDFVLAPGADPTEIQMHIAGAQRLGIASTGAVVEDLSDGGQIEERAPHAFQQVDGSQRAVIAGFRLLGGDRFAFKLGAYDHSRSLTIDPVIAYGTYIGGDGVDGFGADGFEAAGGVGIDAGGDVYAAGSSTGLDFPTTTGAYEATAPGSGLHMGGVILSEFSPHGTLMRSTYFGGYLMDYLSAASMALGPNGVYIGGRVSCGNNYPPTGCDLPVTPNAFDTTYKTQASMSYVAKFDLTLSTLDYSSYLGGTSSGDDELTGVSVDANGDLFVTGSTRSEDFPTTTNAYLRSAGVSGIYYAPQGFLSVVAPTGSALPYSSLFGTYTSPMAVASGPCGAASARTCAYLTGYDRAANFPSTHGVFQPQCPSGVTGTICTRWAAFVSKLDPSKSGSKSLVYSSFLGGNSDDYGIGGIQVDAAGNAYVAGETTSKTFPTCPGPSNTCASHAGLPLRTQLSGSTSAVVGGDGFVTKVNAKATRLLYSTYLAGPEKPGCAVTYVMHLALNSADDVYATGTTCDPQFPVTSDAFQPTMPAQPYSTFVAEINPTLPGDGSGLPGPANPTMVWSSYLGSDGDTTAGGSAVDSSGNLWILGSTSSCDFPVTADAYQPLYVGALGGTVGWDHGFVVKIAPGQAAPLTPSCPAPPAVLSGSGALYSSFGTGGTASTAVPGQGASGTAGSSLVAQADGKVIAVGTVYSGIGQIEGGSIGLARFTSGGALDTTFGSGGTTDASFSGVTVNANAAALQPDGKLLIAGTYWTASGAEGVALARFHAYDAGATPGTVDTSFAAGGIAEVPYQGSGVHALVLQPDGKAVVGGVNSGFLLVRFHAYDTGYAPGSLDATFGSGGIVNPQQTGAVNALAIQPVGSTFAIVAGGQALGPNNSIMQVFALRRYSAADGSLDTSFGNGGEAMTIFDVPVAGGHTVTAYPSVNALAVQPDGGIVAGGTVWLREPDLVSDYALARYTADGAADTTFGSSGKVVSDVYDSDQIANALVLGANGTIILAGGSNGPPGSPKHGGIGSYFLIERFASNGDLDGSFGNDGAVETTFGVGEFAHATGLVVQSDGTIVAGGDTCDFSSGCRLAVARYLE